MKREIIIILTLMPFLALGQSNVYSKFFGDKYSPTEIRFEKHLIWSNSNDSKRNIETTLINDTRHYKSVLNFDLDKYSDVSLTLKNDKTFNWIDTQKSDKILLEVKPLIDSKLQFRKPIEAKSLFEN